MKVNDVEESITKEKHRIEDELSKGLHTQEKENNRMKSQIRNLKDDSNMLQ
jgi:hypothetical protein